MKRASQLGTFLAMGALCLSCAAIEIEFRYDLDTSGFFDQPGAKEALETAAKFYEDLIVDELEAIDPFNFQPGSEFHWRQTYFEPNQGGAELFINDDTQLVVPENTIIIFAAGRNLSTVGQGGPGGIRQFTQNVDWFNQIYSRGESGAYNLSNQNNPTDLGPWGGTIFFDNDRVWNFSSSDASAAPGIDLVSVALHEIGHVLGLGYVSATSSWLNLVSNSRFVGPLATASNGNVSPSLNGFAHWSSSLSHNRTLGIFGRQHGELQEALMDANTGTSSSDQFIVPTDLEIAALSDIGWELSETPTKFEVELNFDPAAPTIGIPTVTGTNYQVYRANSPETLAPSGPEIVGDGSVQIWTDPATPGSKAFYRVEICLDSADKSKAAKKPPQKTSQATVQFPEEGLPTLAPFQCECGFTEE